MTRDFPRLSSDRRASPDSTGQDQGANVPPPPLVPALLPPHNTLSLTHVLLSLAFQAPRELEGKDRALAGDDFTEAPDSQRRQTRVISCFLLTLKHLGGVQ